MLEELVQTLEALQKRIKEHRHHIESYESRTRVTLIDPMLCALGWKVSDPTMVEIEPRVSNMGWADYALLGSNGKPVAFVEAKKLADKDSPIAQLVGYVVTENLENGSNVRYGVSTNGDTWVVCDVWAQKPVMNCSIAKEDASKCALQLLGLWRRSLSDGSFDLPIEPIIDPQKDLEYEPPEPPPPSPEWTPLNSEFPTTNCPPPKAIRLPDGSEIGTKYWRDILVETSRWLWKTSRLTPENCQIQVSKKLVLFSADGTHPEGKAFFNPATMPGGIVLETSFSARDIVRHTRRLLQEVNLEPSTAFLDFRS